MATAITSHPTYDIKEVQENDIEPYDQMRRTDCEPRWCVEKGQMGTGFWGHAQHGSSLPTENAPVTDI